MWACMHTHAYTDTPAHHAQDTEKEVCCNPMPQQLRKWGQNLGGRSFPTRLCTNKMILMVPNACLTQSSSPPPPLPAFTEMQLTYNTVYKFNAYSVMVASRVFKLLLCSKLNFFPELLEVGNWGRVLIQKTGDKTSSSGEQSDPSTPITYPFRARKRPSPQRR